MSNLERLLTLSITPTRCILGKLWKALLFDHEYHSSTTMMSLRKSLPRKSRGSLLLQSRLVRASPGSPSKGKHKGICHPQTEAKDSRFLWTMRQ